MISSKPVLLGGNYPTTQQAHAAREKARREAGAMGAPSANTLSDKLLAAIRNREAQIIANRDENGSDTDDLLLRYTEVRSSNHTRGMVINAKLLNDNKEDYILSSGDRNRIQEQQKTDTKKQTRHVDDALSADVPDLLALLGPEQLEALRERYDVSTLDAESLEALALELRELGVPLPPMEPGPYGGGEGGTLSLLDDAYGLALEQIALLVSGADGNPAFAEAKMRSAAGLDHSLAAIGRLYGILEQLR